MTVTDPCFDGQFFNGFYLSMFFSFNGFISDQFQLVIFYVSAVTTEASFLTSQLLSFILLLHGGYINGIVNFFLSSCLHGGYIFGGELLKIVAAALHVGVGCGRCFASWSCLAVIAAASLVVIYSRIENGELCPSSTISVSHACVECCDRIGGYNE